jgi:hypothetical protein
MEPTKELMDAIYRDRVPRARQQSLEEKLLAGPRLFDMACRAIRAWIRRQFPDADEEFGRQLLFELIAMKQRLEDVPCRTNLL